MKLLELTLIPSAPYLLAETPSGGKDVEIDGGRITGLPELDVNECKRPAEEDQAGGRHRSHMVYYKLESLFGLFVERRQRSPPPHRF